MITWRQAPGIRSGVAIAYEGAAENVEYLVEARDEYDYGKERYVRTYSTFRIIGGRPVAISEHHRRPTRKAAYEAAAADLAIVLADRGVH